ncbi:MAG: hypothetical protein IPI42_14620 [Saprospiraceae bacterium]|nr:hypothetical protein [Candidatus Parvibacillus calidus]
MLWVWEAMPTLAVCISRVSFEAIRLRDNWQVTNGWWRVTVMPMIGCVTGRCSTSDLRTSLLIRWWRFKGGSATGLWGDLTYLKVMMQ